MQDKKRDNPKALATNKSAFFSAVKTLRQIKFVSSNPISNQLMLLLTLALMKAVAAELFTFEYEGDHYAFKREPRMSRYYGDVAEEFFQNVTEALLQGVCGNITRSNLLPIDKLSLWGEDFCHSQFNLTSDAHGNAHPDFEDCLINTAINPQIPDAREQCQPKPITPLELGLIIGIPFGVICLICTLIGAVCHSSRPARQPNLNNANPNLNNEQETIIRVTQDGITLDKEHAPYKSLNDEELPTMSNYGSINNP